MGPDRKTHLRNIAIIVLLAVAVWQVPGGDRAGTTVANVLSLIFLGGSATQTLPVAMYTYVGGLVSAWNKIFAVVIISMVPILLFYMFAQKRFIQGFAGGLKG